MRLDPTFQIEKATSSDITRTSICDAYLDVEKSKLVATDGKMMAIVPVTGTESDTTGLVSPAAIKAARAIKGTDGVVIVANSMQYLTTGATFPRPEAIFPPYDQVIPPYRKGDEGTLTISLDAALLLDLCKAIGAHTRSGAKVEITFTPGQLLDPYVIETKDGAIGILMPCKVE